MVAVAVLHRVLRVVRHTALVAGAIAGEDIQVPHTGLVGVAHSAVEVAVMAPHIVDAEDIDPAGDVGKVLHRVVVVGIDLGVVLRRIAGTAEHLAEELRTAAVLDFAVADNSFEIDHNLEEALEDHRAVVDTLVVDTGPVEADDSLVEANLSDCEQKMKSVSIKLDLRLGPGPYGG